MVVTRPAATKTSRCLDTDCLVTPIPALSSVRVSPLRSLSLSRSRRRPGSPSALNTASISLIAIRWYVVNHATVRLHGLHSSSHSVACQEARRRVRADLAGPGGRVSLRSRQKPRLDRPADPLQGGEHFLGRADVQP